MVLQQEPWSTSPSAITRGGDQRLSSPTAHGAGGAPRLGSALIKQVYESDPLSCPKCGSQMKIIAFIERRQTEVIEKILRHCRLCGLWEESPARAPPAEEETAVG